MYSDSDAINQIIIKMVTREKRKLFICINIQCQQIPLTIENFLLVVRTTDSTTELTTLNERLDIEISRWRSKDTGGENGTWKFFYLIDFLSVFLDAEIRATLNSYQYLKKLLADRVDTQMRLEPMVFVWDIFFYGISSDFYRMMMK